MVELLGFSLNVITMLEYYILSALTLCLSIVKFNNTKLQLFCCLMPWLLLIAGRVNWTADYSSYDFMFDERHNWSWAFYVFSSFESKFEPAFFALIKYLPSYRWVIIVQSSVLILSIYILFYKYIPVRCYPLAFTLWLFNATFFESFAAMRSTFVIVLFIFAVVMKLNAKLIPAILLVLISGLFHNSGFLMLPLICISPDFIFKHFNLSVFGIVFLLFVALVAPSVYSNYLSSMMEDSGSMDYSGYIQETSYGLGYYFFTCIRIVVIGFLLVAVKKELMPKKYNYFILISIVFYVMNSIPGIGLIYRINCYLRPLLIVCLCCYYYHTQKRIGGSLRAYSKLLIFVVVIEMIFSFSSFYVHPNYESFYKDYESAFF